MLKQNRTKRNLVKRDLSVYTGTELLDRNMNSVLLLLLLLLLTIIILIMVVDVIS